MLAPEARSGAQAVERAQAEKALAASDQSAAPANEQVKQVGDKAFVLHDGTWLDTSFDANTMQAEPVSFGSDRYFQLIAENPELGRYLALGDRVTVLLAGSAFAIGPTGQTDAVPAPITAATQVPLPSGAPASSLTPSTRQATAEPRATPAAPASTRSQVLTSDRTAPEATAVSAPATVPASAQQAGTGAPTQIPCPTAGAVGLVAAGLPVWMRRRRRSDL
jgi:MYXO-CTERM domain-containing protein